MTRWVDVGVDDRFIYIFACGRCFHPDRLKVPSTYNFFISILYCMCSLGFKPTTLHWSEHAGNSCNLAIYVIKMQVLDHFFTAVTTVTVLLLHTLLLESDVSPKNTNVSCTN